MRNHPRQFKAALYALLSTAVAIEVELEVTPLSSFLHLLSELRRHLQKPINRTAWS